MSLGRRPRDALDEVAVSEEEPLIFDFEKARRTLIQKDEELVPTVEEKDDDVEFMNFDENNKGGNDKVGNDEDDSSTVIDTSSSSSPSSLSDKEDDDDVIFVREVKKVKPEQPKVRETLGSFLSSKGKERKDREKQVKEMQIVKEKEEKKDYQGRRYQEEQVRGQKVQSLKRDRSSEKDDEEMDDEKLKRINEALFRLYGKEKSKDKSDSQRVEDVRKKVVPVEQQPSKKEDTKKEDPTKAYEKLESEILQLYQKAQERYKILTTYERNLNPRMFNFFVLGAANLARSIANKEDILFIDEKLRDRFLNVAAMSIFKNIMQDNFSLNQVKAVASTIPETILLTRLYDARGMILSILRGVPVYPENLNPKRKRFETLPVSKLNASFEVKNLNPKDNAWNFRFSLPDPRSDAVLMREVEEVLQKFRPFFEAEKLNKDILVYVSEYETNPRIYEDLVKKANERDFEWEEKKQKLQRRQQVIAKTMKEKEEEDDDDEMLGMDLIGRIGGSQKSSFSFRREKESSGSLFKNDDDDEKLESIVKEEEENALISAQPDALEMMSFVDDDVDNVNEVRDDETFLVNSIKVIARISRNDAEKELHFNFNDDDEPRKLEEITKRAKEIWYKYLENPKMLVPLSRHFYDKTFVSDSLSVSDYLKGKK